MQKLNNILWWAIGITAVPVLIFVLIDEGFIAGKVYMLVAIAALGFTMANKHRIKLFRK
ncbi:MAG: hypothetical protein SGJ10_09830 [Bacteroidota bacterium]|nr:hypothetical protein [Bacteroidota bacterium]